MISLTALRERVDDDIDPPSVLVISDRHVGSEVVTTLDRSTNVCLVTDHDGVAGQTPDDTRVVVGDGRERAVLRDAGAQTTDVALISMQTDHGAFLVTQLLRTQFDVETVVVVLNDPQHRPAFESVASEVVCSSQVLATELERAVATTLQTPETA
ncbi:TrkA family protein [Haloarcula quadrata]|jgi:Trk K+ transport system NAD-binding subunit|uniref:NAD-binding protein n=3 Tax=Haloarcula TaxID=2237 RepID=M0K2V9_9EURY|nr:MULTISPECIES: NAD-binding protein [Haloarcula]EMA15787.1 Trk potassium uptake system protein [Haloarcula sinaiiensis ATCC 33800]EMA26924.1 Trk potassium uptake system protein [Haloarcula californiae ATCC 33799]QUJ72631.1 NAD-binding protein [Haloarcula sinaiiensis ATCC 33800]RKS83392.1 TrkA family protein [Haloarcula quadrata]